MIDDLMQLVAIKSDSVEGANRAIDWCANWLTEKNIPFTRLENDGRSMIHAEVGSGNNTIVWNGHVDVVPGNEDQFQPYIEDNKLYGRGTADMKAGVIAMMHAFAHVYENQQHLSKRIFLHIASDEETGGELTSGYLVKHGYTGDFVICGEPTHLQLSLQSKGIIQFDCTLHGKAAHGSRPWLGENAIEAAYSLHEKIKQLPFTTASNDFFESPSINIAKIHAGDRYNVVPALCTVSYDIRFVPGQNPKEILQQIEDALIALHPQNSIHIHEIASAVTTTKAQQEIVELQQILKEVTGDEAVLFAQHGAADTRFYAEAGATGAIEFGPSGANWHGLDEYAHIPSIYQFAEVLKKFAFQ